MIDVLVVAVQNLLGSSRIDAKSDRGRDDWLPADGDLMVSSPESVTRGNQDIGHAGVEMVACKLDAGVGNAQQTHSSLGRLWEKARLIVRVVVEMRLQVLPDLPGKLSTNEIFNDDTSIAFEDVN